MCITVGQHVFFNPRCFLWKRGLTGGLVVKVTRYRIHVLTFDDGPLVKVSRRNIAAIGSRLEKG